jgi:predicted transcriptional regulator of viral defense system
MAALLSREIPMPTKTEAALQIIAAGGGTVRTSEALAVGIHPRTLYALRDSGRLIRLARGLYRLSDLPPVGDPDLALVAGRIPQGVVCLISALAIHNLTTQIPHSIHLAISRTARYPILDEVPLAVYRFSRHSFSAGVIDHDFGGSTVRIFDAEKSIADCFKYRNKIGIDITLEALALYKKRRGGSIQRILEYARINRVDTKIRPYLEASI